MNQLVICPWCRTVKVVINGSPAGYCKCLDAPPITSPVAFVRLVLPEGVSIVVEEKAYGP